MYKDNESIGLTVRDLIPFIDYTCILTVIDLDNNIIGEYDFINQMINDDLLSENFVYKCIIPDSIRDLNILHIFPNDLNHLQVVVFSRGVKYDGNK